MMKSRTRARAGLAVGVSALALLSGYPALAAGAAAPNADAATIGEIVVTAQRREERLQNVPIAVSAFSEDMLQKQKIDGGPGLQLAVPNVTFSKGFYSGYNFQIRGID